MANRRSVISSLLNCGLAIAFPVRTVRSTFHRWFGWKPPSNPENILVVRADHIGDVFLSTPALAWIRDIYPNSHITLVVATWAEPIVRHLTLHDELVVCDTPWWTNNRAARFGASHTQGTWSNLWGTVKRLRKSQFDLCIELRGDVRQIVFFGALTGSKHILTRSRNGGHWLANAAPDIDEQVHEAEQNMQLLAALKKPTPTQLTFSTPFAAVDLQAVDVLVDKSPLLLIHPGAKQVNRWPEAFYGRVMASLADIPDLKFAITGAPSERELCERLRSAAPENAINFAGRLSLTQHAALMSRASLVVMADTGPMHFLNAMNTSAVLLFGPTPSKRFAPKGAHVVVLQGAPCCSAQLHETCTWLQPDNQQHSACMGCIQPETVASNLRKSLLKQATPSADAHLNRP